MGVASITPSACTLVKYVSRSYTSIFERYGADPRETATSFITSCTAPGTRRPFLYTSQSSRMRNVIRTPVSGDPSAELVIRQDSSCSAPLITSFRCSLAFS